MQLSDMTKSMIGLRSLSLKSAKEYQATSDAKLSKGADVDGEKSYKISSIIRHFNEHYISQLSMLH